MKRRLFVCFLALTMLLSLTACGAASKTAASSANSRPADTVSATEEKGYFDAETNAEEVFWKTRRSSTPETSIWKPRRLTRPLRRWQRWRRSRAAIWRAAP